MSDSPVEGEMFRRNYLRRLEKLPDSLRARRRVTACFEENLADTGYAIFAKTVERELGIEYPRSRYGNNRNGLFWTQCELGDFLSAITIFLNLIGVRAEVLAEVRRIFKEEDIHYKVDDQGGVHYLIDEEFDLAVSSTLNGLEATRFTAARKALEEGLESLGGKKQSGKALIRGVFEAIESAYLVVIDEKSNRLNDQSIAKHLKPLLIARYDGVPDAEDKVSRMLETFSKYVKSAHPYRHGAPLDKIHEAPLDEAILSASIGMGFLRYLVSE